MDPSSPEAPWSVRVASQAIGGWIARLGAVWVEGQVAQISRRPGARVCFLTLRDAAADISLNVMVNSEMLNSLEPPLADGATVVMQAKPQWYAARGQLTMVAHDIRPVGVGELLARLEALKKVLVGEGLADPGRKKPLPFLPSAIGLITGRASAAERDVVENATRRWPAVRFITHEVPVQGNQAVPAVIKALEELDSNAEVEVIIIARGGGSLEDLLPFSNEAMCRAVAAAKTPVVSAIGHEVDHPLLDLVADWRASTPTDAGKRVVPDVAEELSRIARDRDSLRRTIRNRIDSEQQIVMRARERARTTLTHRVERASGDVAQLLARVKALSPQSTLDRGYAVVQLDSGGVVRSASEAPAGTHLRIRVADGTFEADAR